MLGYNFNYILRRELKSILKVKNLKSNIKNYSICNKKASILPNIFFKYNCTFGKSNSLIKCFYKENQELFTILKRSQLNQSCSTCYFSTSNQNSQNKDERNNSDSSSSDDKKNSYYIYICAAAAIISYIFMKNTNIDQHTQISWNDFLRNYLSKGEVQELLVYPNRNIVHITLYSDALVKGKRVSQPNIFMEIASVEQFEHRLREAEDALNIRSDQRIPVVYHDPYTKIILGLTLSLIFISFLLSKISLPLKVSVGGSRAKFTIIDPMIPGSGKGVKLSDIAGSEQAKQELVEFVEFLKNPSRYQKLGAKMPKGALLLGPPGTGKTMLAKAVASEGFVPFLSMNGSEFIEMIGGVGAGRVRDLFREAKSRAPCIIYIDEIDAIGKHRSSGMSAGDGASQESEQTLNQLLVEMDGIMSKEGVVLLGSTNRLDILDKALLRPGRFDRHILMELPTLEERKLIFDHHLKSIILEKPIESYSKRLAHLTLGFSGADIANVANEGALCAVRKGHKNVTASDLEYAVEKATVGDEKKNQALSPEEKKMVAFHEAGHVLAGWLLEHTDALLKVSIIPRTTQALGFSQYTPKDKYLFHEEELFQKMCMLLAGRVAESLIFNKVTTSANDDLQKVTKMANDQVRIYGFNEKVGKVSFPQEDEREENYRKRFFSNKMAFTIEQESSKIIFEAYKVTEQLINQNMDKLTKLADALLKKETLMYKDVEALIGPPPHKNKTSVEQEDFENEVKSWIDNKKS